MPSAQSIFPAHLLRSCLLLATLPALLCSAQPRPLTARAPMPQLVHRDGRYALMVDGAPYLMLAAQINNSSSWPASMPAVWPTVEALHLNTVEAPVYWEQMEPEEGRFDFSTVDMLLAQSREHHVRLVILWFGTWKNGSGHYAPLWVKRNNAKYPHLVKADGTTVDSLSPASDATLAADQHAFVALMHHLKAADPQHTLILVQVENESGTYGSQRDFSPASQRLFDGPVPAAIVSATSKQPGTWKAVFGDQADEFFHAWSIATYINRIAAAGKAEYPIPMYANAALRDPINPGTQGSWENGGPTDDVLPIWKAAAPALDLLAPDIYMSQYDKYMKVLDLYQRPDNALFVPETGNGMPYAKYCFAAIGRGALGWSPFGMDQTGYSNAPMGPSRLNPESLQQFTYNNALLGPISPIIAKLNFEGKVQGVAEDPAVHVQRLAFGNWMAIVSYGRPQFGGGDRTPPGNEPADGEALIAQLGPDEFLVAGYHARVDFEPAGGRASGLKRQFLEVQEGTYTPTAKWLRARIWNGDQTDYGLNLRTAPQLLRVTLATY